MNTITFKLARIDDWAQPVVQIIIDNRDFSEIASAIEMPFAPEKGDPEVEKGGIGIILGKLFLTGGMSPSEGTEVELVCKGYGEEGFWPLEMSIRVQGDAIWWLNFRQPNRPQKDLSRLGPFIFKKEQYDAEILKLQGKSFGV